MGLHIHIHTADGFDESKHPRKDDGKFSAGAGAHKKSDYARARESEEDDRRDAEYAGRKKAAGEVAAALKAKADVVAAAKAKKAQERADIAKAKQEERDKRLPAKVIKKPAPKAAVRAGSKAAPMSGNATQALALAKRLAESNDPDKGKK